MIPSLEKDLRKCISKERKLEMEKYERTKIYDQISEFLQGDTQIAFSLINHTLAIIDDKIDIDGNKERLDKAKAILSQGFQGKKAKLAETEIWEKDIFKLGQTLSKLYRDNFSEAKEIFNEIINYWEIETQNLNRKWKIINSHDLDNLNLGIGKSISLQFLYLLCHGLDKESRESIASSYGLAIKLADNISDLSEDLKRGYINISRETIDKFRIKLTNLSEKDLQQYVKEEFKRVKQYYKKGDIVVEKISKQYPSQKEGLLIFQNIAHSWFKQVSEFAFVQELRQFDIANHPLPKFLSEREILEMEKFYGINLSDVITLSYSQEARNTYIIRKKDLSYNPYFHEKTFQANEEIKKLINSYSEIKDVLDLGCDDGSRTLKLFGGKKLYGIELVEKSAKEAKKRGIQVYQGSIINDFYKDKTYLKGRKFDLVSIMGEMLNFVGLDTNALLANAIIQIKDKGYFLVSCMHSKFDKLKGGNYVVWSFKDSTDKRWILKEEKIPRTFLLLSKQGLLKKLKKIAQVQNCHLIFKNEEIIENYYEGMLLGIYIFQKHLN